MLNNKLLSAYKGFYKTLSLRLGVVNDWHVAIKSHTSWMGYLLRCSILLGDRCRSQDRLCVLAFARYTRKIMMAQGTKALCLRLKASNQAIQKFTDFHTKVRSGMGDLGVPISLTNDGLPRWIPSVLRQKIRLGDAGVIASLLTLCSLYRVLEYSGGKVKDTITAPGKEFALKPYQNFIPIFAKLLAIQLARYCKVSLIPNSVAANELPSSISEFDIHEDHSTLGDIPRQPFKVKAVEPLMIFKSGPGSKPLPVQLELGGLSAAEKAKFIGKLTPEQIEAGAFAKNLPKRLGRLFLSETLLLGNSTSALILQAATFCKPEHKSLLHNYGRVASFFEGGNLIVSMLRRIGSNFNEVGVMNAFRPKHLGKLGFKQEPAGKVRVFAMVTWWDQVLLKPLHSYIFGLLLALAPMDGTFDQDAAVNYGNEQFRKYGIAYSFDLSAATDRLPILIQILLVDLFFPGLGQFWADLLVKRDYRMGPRKSVRYSVGQPMGALSSWPMLAITHHFIVQLAAYRAGHRGWFTGYMVLGDDVVIFHKGVASQYLLIMKDLGVGINLTKSVQSTDCFEFAKRFCFRGQTLPVLSFREMDVAAHSLDGLIQLMYRLRGINWKLTAVMKFKGYGYKALCHMTRPLDLLPKGLSTLLVMLSYPGVSPLSFARYVDWISMIRINYADTARINLLQLSSVLRAFLKSMEPIGSSASLVARDIFGPVGLYLRSFDAYAFEDTLERLQTRLTRSGKPWLKVLDNPQKPVVIGGVTLFGGRLAVPSSALLRYLGIESWIKGVRDFTTLYHLVGSHCLLGDIESDVQTLLWPLQEGYMAGHRQADAALRRLSALLEIDFLLVDDAEDSMLMLTDWLTQRDVQPAKVAVYEHASGVPKSFSGQWLKFFAHTRSVLPRLTRGASTGGKPA